MKTPDSPDNEAQRLLDLVAHNILDTKADERFDRIARLAQRTFNVPIALVSIVDKDRQWFKSRCGLDAEQTSRDISFCGHAILGDAVFVVENALEDERFSDNPLVTGPPNIRFYAGCPLSSSQGHKLGTLCIIDDKPRSFDSESRELLASFAEMVECELKELCHV
ncbi:GAF domain-containing protein [Dasania marina]|uniref:GAF domain-containing protein n=1 Tax=Dasania marina TaxID=471499 RepID=UPI0003617437|nr:GAF domain-containing protein [Dasania marina]